MEIKSILLSSVITLGLLSGCSEDMAISTDKMISNVLESDNKLESYYAEGNMNVYEGDTLIEKMTFQEWHSSDGKKKIVTKDEIKQKSSYVMNDGKQLLIYEEGSDVANSIDISDEEFVSSMPSQREILIQMLEQQKDTHSYEFTGEEEVNGVKTNHIKVTKKSKKSILGDMELWIDPKGWFIMKSKMVNGENKIEHEYTKVDASPQFTDDTFTLTLPNDVEIQPVKDETVTLEEAEKALDTSFLTLNKEIAEIEKIELDELKGEINRSEVTVYYKKDDIPLLMLSIFPTPKDDEDEVGFPEEEEITVRGLKGLAMKELNMFQWDEEGLRYSLIIEHPDMSVDEVIALLEKMEWSSDR